MLRISGLVLIFIVLFTTYSMSETKAAAKSNTGSREVMNTSTINENQSPVTADQMRCEKRVLSSLIEFKAALVENCNLNKPFSSSLSRVLNDEVYFYCCHKK